MIGVGFLASADECWCSGRSCPLCIFIDILLFGVCEEPTYVRLPSVTDQLIMTPEDWMGSGSQGLAASVFVKCSFCQCVAGYVL